MLLCVNTRILNPGISVFENNLELKIKLLYNVFEMKFRS